MPDTLAQSLAPKDDGFKNLSFTFAVIALSARVACAGGTVTTEKYLAFRELFPLRGGMCGKLRALFTLACQNTAPIEHYANQVKHTFPGQNALFVSLVGRLFCIASAGESISPQTERMLARIAHILELSPAQYAELRYLYVDSPDPHAVLGTTRRTPASGIKKRYRELMRNWHPDRFASEDLSPEIAMLLKLKASEINDAYRHLAKNAA